MKRTRVELLTNIRGKSNLWEKGHIFDTADGPLPKDIDAEVASLKGKSGNKLIRLLPLPIIEQKEDDEAKAKAEAEAQAKAEAEAKRKAEEEARKSKTGAPK